MLESLFGAPVQQEAEDESPQARSATARRAEELEPLQGRLMPDHVAQRKPLSAGKLNVAGEDHGESGDRRVPEREYARDKGVNDYWKEGDFTYMPPDTRPGFLKSLPRALGGPKETHGDPLMLRAEHLLAMLDEKHSDVFLAQFARGEVPREFGTRMALDQAWKSYCEESLIGAVREPGVAIRMANASEGEKDTAEKFIPHYGMLARIVTTVADNHRITETGRITEIASRIARDIKNVRAEFTRTATFPANRPEDVISRDRSDAMLNAASQSGKRGLWKVGNSHVTDVRTKGTADETPAYRLMSREEFNEDYDKWDLENRELLIAEYTRVRDSRDGARILEWYQRMADSNSKYSKASREIVLGRSHVERMWIDLDEANKKSVLKALNSSGKLAAMSEIIWVWQM